MLILATAALGAERPKDEVDAHTEASRRYGKDIPWAATCFARPTPWEGAAPLVVGVSKAATGCETYGVVVNGAWSEPADALQSLVPADAWKALTPQERQARATAFVDQVLLAFTEPDPGPAKVTTGRDGALTVVRKDLRRDGRDGRAAEVTKTVVIGPDEHVTSATEVVDHTWETSFFVRDADTAGLGGDGAVDAALAQVGGGLQRCVDLAWHDQMTLAGFVKLQWTVEADRSSPGPSPGKVTDVAQVDEATLPDGLVRCLGEGLRRVAWPEGTAGSATCTFLVDRR